MINKILLPLYIKAMVEIEFNYNQRITAIQAQLDEHFQNLINKFLQKSLIQPGLVYFLCKWKTY